MVLLPCKLLKCCLENLFAYFRGRKEKTGKNPKKGRASDKPTGKADRNLLCKAFFQQSTKILSCFMQIIHRFPMSVLPTESRTFSLKAWKSRIVKCSTFSFNMSFQIKSALQDKEISMQSDAFCLYTDDFSIRVQSGIFYDLAIDKVVLFLAFCLCKVSFA